MTTGVTGRVLRRFSLASLAAAALFVFANAPKAAAQEALAASCEPPWSAVFIAGPGPVAQPFTSQLSGNLTRAEASLKRGAGTNETFIVQIRTVDSSGVPTAVVLATAAIPAANVSDGAPELVGVAFTSPAPVVAGQQYAIVVSRPGGGFDAGVRDDANPPPCPGTLKWFNGTTWEERVTLNLVFRVFVTPPGAPGATCKGQPVTLVGTNGNDELFGTANRDVIGALDGNDEVRGLDGKDVICGGKNKDTLRGGKGMDKLLGQKGKDRLRGGGGRDVCKGGKGDDSARRCEKERSI